MSFRAVEWALGVDGISPMSKLVLVVLCRHADDDGQCWPSITRIENVTGLSRSAVVSHIKILEVDGHISRSKRRREDACHDISITKINIPPSALKGLPSTREGLGGSAPDGRGVVRQSDSNTVKENIYPRDLPDWMPTEEWSNFLSYRQSQATKQKPFSSQAAILAISKLTKLREAGHDPAEVINQTIMNSWTGLFEIKGNRPSAQPLSAREQMRRTTPGG